MHDHHKGRCQFQGPIWVLVADKQQAQIYEWRKTGNCGEADKCCGGHRSHELIPLANQHFRAENIVVNSHRQRGGDEQCGDKMRFVRAIVHTIQAAYHSKSFEKLVLVAPAKMIGGLREQMPSPLQHNIAAVLPKDLGHCDRYELLVHLQDTLREAQVA